MAITSSDDPMYVTDFEFLLQECTSVKTDFDTDAQNEWMESKLIEGKNPENFARIWAHTHPGPSATPSGTDWDTFQEAMGEAAWGVMLILGQSNEFVCVFRCRDQMLNLHVEVEDATIPEAWLKELDNIQLYVPPKTKTYTKGWSNPNQYVLGTPPTQKASKRYAIDLPFWDTDDPVSFGGFTAALNKLPGNPRYTTFQQFNPTFEEIMEYGPVKLLNVLKTMYREVMDAGDERRFKQCCETVGRVLFDDANGITGHDTIGSCWWEPVALLAALQDKELTESQYDGICDDVKKFVKFNQKDNQWYMKSTAKISKAIPQWLTSGAPIDREIAYSSLMSLSIHYPDYGEKHIDAECRKLIRQYLKAQEEYHQCQKQHEANVS